MEKERYCLVTIILALLTMLTSTAILCVADSSKPNPRPISVQRSLTIEERVNYQWAIEEVYWRNRSWPASTPKPALSEILISSTVESKVNDYLERTVDVGGKQLQVEIDRMISNSKHPRLLNELFQALDNDPFIIAECLARATLAQQESRNQILLSSKSLKNFQPPIYDYKLTPIPLASCTPNAWEDTSTANVPSGRFYHAAVWTGAEMFVWGGNDGTSLTYIRTGGMYNPSTDTWSTVTTNNAPSSRYGPRAVWTGTEVIVWGGFDGFNELKSGGRYNPIANTWSATSENGAPEGRIFPGLVWTGTEMIVWGGELFDAHRPVGTGGRYNPSTNSWTAVSTSGAPDARTNHTVIWTGTEMITWGGSVFAHNLDTGSRYNPSNNTWKKTAQSMAPTARTGHNAVWTGTEMIILGGIGDVGVNTEKGGIYNPSTDTWTRTNDNGAPSQRAFSTAIWSGTDVILWGGQPPTFSDYLNDGGRYDPASDKWTPLSAQNAPHARAFHNAIFTGSEMIVWGGGFPDFSSNALVLLDTGGRLCVNAPAVSDFSLSCKPASVTSVPDDSTNSNCTIGSVAGFNSAVNLTCTGLPAGFTCDFGTNPVTPPAGSNAKSSLTINLDAGVLPGNYSFKVHGVGGGINHDFNISAKTVNALFAENFSGGANGWSATGGTWNIVPSSSLRSGFALQGTVDKKGQVLSPDFNLGVGTMEADVRILTPDAKASLLVWFADKKNLISLELAEKKDKLTLKQKGGGDSDKASAKRSIDVDVTYHLKVTFDGQDLQVFVDNEPDAIITMPVVASPSGKIGFAIKASGGSTSAWITNIVAY